MTEDFAKIRAIIVERPFGCHNRTYRPRSWVLYIDLRLEEFCNEFFPI